MPTLNFIDVTTIHVEFRYHVCLKFCNRGPFQPYLQSPCRNRTIRIIIGLHIILILMDNNFDIPIFQVIK